ncbi:MAG: hypothetical protein NW226_21090 [Microscillaceae bacterium]|nr:hypothetical protein [Microscillaceae bacterium]
MIYSTQNLALILLSAVLFFNCGGGETSSEETADKDSAQTEETTNKAAEPDANPEALEGDLKEFLFSVDGTYGWRSEQDENLYDFFKDGRWIIQGPEGEATMWQGKWTLEADQLSLECKDCGTLPAKQTLTVKKDGENLVLGDKTYTRYAPEQ